VEAVGCRVLWGVGCRVKGLRLAVWGLGFRVKGFGLRV
jgi:hypothetical protein